MEPSLESCLPTAGLLCPFPCLSSPTGKGAKPSDVWRPGSSWVPGEGVDRTAAPEHPPWGRAPKDAHHVKCQRPSLFCALLFLLLLFIPQQLYEVNTTVTPFLQMGKLRDRAVK